MNEPVRLYKLAYLLGLPAGWLKSEADAGRIPCLRVGDRYLFHVPAVKDAIYRQAAHKRLNRNNVEVDWSP